MTAAKSGEVVEPVAHPDLLAPGTVQRPDWIDEATWLRMPWPAQWKAARRSMPPVRRPERVEEPEPVEERRHKGPVATQPHGTYAAARRHERRGERPCIPCATAMRVYKRTTPEARIRRHPDDVDHILVDRFVRDEASWEELTVEERIIAARRLDDAGVSRRIIKIRTHLNTTALRSAFAPSPALSTGRVDETPCAAQHSERAS